MENNSEYFQQKEIVVNNVAKFLVKLNNTRSHVKYALSFMTCELLNILNVILNFFIVELFLNWKFTNLGYVWLKAPGEKVLADVFPRMTMCSWEQYGAGGDVRESLMTVMCNLGLLRERKKTICVCWPQTELQRKYLSSTGSGSSSSPSSLSSASSTTAPCSAARA